MLTIINLIIILLLLGCISMWATYGFFSAFIQLIVVIIAGTLAFALWEPVSYMLLGRMPTYAHGVGLLAPFALLLIVLRTALDKLCKANVHMPRIADQIGGGFCGALIGVLAFGVLLIGINFMPIDKEALGGAVTLRGQEIDDESGQLWLEINVWSGGFFSAISAGSMSPIGGISLAEGRPDLAERAMTYRMPPDTNQMRSAHPGSVQVTGVYAIPATPDAIKGLAQRTAIMSFLKPGYPVPQDVQFGEDGLGLINRLISDLNARYADSEANGRPSDMLNIEAILDVSRTPKYNFENAGSQQNFPRFIRMVADKMTEDLVARLEPVMGENKVLYVVDTDWKNEHPGTFNTDNKLRIAVSSVQLQAATNDGFEMIAPAGYSIEYSQNTGGRIFTEIVSAQADDEAKQTAYSKYTEFSMGWIFPVDAGQTPERFFVRELRFDLDKLDKPAGQETRVNQNIGAAARVIGAPLLPSAAALEAQENASPVFTDGVKIVGSNARADLSEALPSVFSGSAVSYDFDRDADPWTVTSGRGEKLPRGARGSNAVRAITVADSERLIRITLDTDRAKSLYGRAIGAAKSLGVMRIVDEGGNARDAIGFALLRADGTMDIDIRSDAMQGGLFATELPRVGAGETLMIYFQAPIGDTFVAYQLGNDKMAFEQPLEITRD
ncbi:MAG: CvpA family protein [Planctomycetota bacterium]